MEPIVDYSNLITEIEVLSDRVSPTWFTRCVERAEQKDGRKYGRWKNLPVDYLEAMRSWLRQQPPVVTIETEAS